jgi:DNA-binding NtrC family response regulator
MISILYIDDDPKAQKTLNMVLGEKYRVVSAYTGGSGLAKIKEMSPDVVLLDIDLPDKHGIDVLKEIVTPPLHPPVIMLTIITDIKLVVAAIQIGAYDYIVKPYTLSELEGSIWRAALNGTVRREPVVEHPSLDAIIGESPAIKNVKGIIPRYAIADIPVLILGESGTGKELVARAIHDLSPRNGKSFVALNCGAIPQSIVESEMFGAEKGAFTDAVKREGFFEQADNGSIFLDEIGELALSTQAKFLRVMESKEIYRVGGNMPIKLNTRIIAATNRDLKESMSKGGFRQDLYYRLAVLTITLPPLRDRADDIPLLASHFVKLISKGRKKLSLDTCEKLASHDWPGNVRELKNVLDRACVLCDDETIRQTHIIFN